MLIGENSKSTLRRIGVVVGLLFTCVWQPYCWGVSAKAQEADSIKVDLSAPPGLGTKSLSARTTPKYAKFSAIYRLESGSREGKLEVTAEITDGWHVYSTTQSEGGPLRTQIIVEAAQASLKGPFVPDRAPRRSREEVWPDIEIEDFDGTVTWTAPIEVSSDELSELNVSVVGQVCKTDGMCIPLKEKLTASFAGTYEKLKTESSLKVEGTHATWSATISPNVIKPGDSATIRIRANTESGYHVYPFVAKDGDTAFRTLIVATDKSGLLLGSPTTAAEVQTVDIGLDEPVRYHSGSVEWTIPVTVPKVSAEGNRELTIQVGFTTCDDRSCDAPAGIQLVAPVTIASETDENSKAEFGLSSIEFAQVAGLPSFTKWIDGSDGPTDTAVATTEESTASRLSGTGLEPWMVASALLGGFLLNFMPCVLPVIGLKLMSFVNQSGSHRSKIIALNLTHVAGIISVLLVLAAANVAAKLAGDAFGWGQQFTHIQFQVPLTVLVFAMALSFLGVWEIPIPGFATSSKSGELLEKEGLSGAFFKGALTTVLATPCSGPFLGTLFGVTLTLSATSIVLLYILVGLGLGMPYLLLCIHPGLIKLLPKPGVWMETLKELLAFPLLLSVVYFLSIISPDYRIATLVLLIFVWLGCWLIGRVPAYAEARRIRAAWGSAGVIAVIGAVIGFVFCGPVKHDVPWEPYNEALLAKYRSEGKTVMIEFTARWCLTCQTNMKFAIDRPNVAQLIRKNNVIPLLADWSEPSDEIFGKIRELNSLSIPLLAIYPADREAKPIILRDTITETQLLDALESAGPSQPSSHLTSSQVD